MPVIGDKVQFRPFKHATGFASDDNRRKVVTGTVVEINYGKRWFRVRNRLRGTAVYSVFKFSQFGKDVTACG